MNRDIVRFQGDAEMMEIYLQEAPNYGGAPESRSEPSIRRSSDPTNVEKQAHTHLYHHHQVSIHLLILY